MYVRMTFFKVQNGKMGELRDLYNKEVIPAHKGHKGVRFVHLLESLDNSDEGISVTAWDTKADVDAYEKSGDYLRGWSVYSMRCIPGSRHSNHLRSRQARNRFCFAYSRTDSACHGWS